MKVTPEVEAKETVRVGCFGCVSSFGDENTHTEDPKQSSVSSDIQNNNHNNTCSSSESPSPVQKQSHQINDPRPRDVQAQEGRVDCGDRGVWRDTTAQVDGARASSSSTTATGRVWSHQRKEEDRHEAMGCSPQHGQQEEVRATGVLSSGARSTCERQRDHCPASERSNGQDLPGECSRPPGSCEIWKGSVIDVRRGEARSSILPVGEDYIGRRRSDQSTTCSSGPMVDHTGPTSPRGDQGPQDEHLPERTRDCSQSKSSTQEGSGQDRERVRREYGQQQQHPDDDDGHADHDGDYEGVEGRGCGVARAATPQEEPIREEFRRRLQHGESAPNLGLASHPAQHGKEHSKDKPPSRLTEETAKYLEKQTREVVPQIFQSLVGPRKTYLVEVACTPESVLTKTVQEKAGYPEAAIRCSNWNNHDLCTGEGVKLILGVLDTYEPSHVWITTECGPFSPMQNLNQRTEKQQEELQEKRKDALRQYVGASIVLHYAIQKGIHVSWEWAEKSHAWRLPLIQKIIEKYQLWVSVTHGCQVNLRDPKTQRFLRKGWKVMTTHKRLSMLLDLPCRCPKQETHAKCERKLTSQSALYTKEFAKRVVSALFQEMTHCMVQQELDGDSQTPKDFGVGPYCMEPGSLDLHQAHRRLGWQ